MCPSSKQSAIVVARQNETWQMAVVVLPGMDGRRGLSPESEVLVGRPRLPDEGPRDVGDGALGAQAEGLRDVRAEDAPRLEAVERTPRFSVHLKGGREGGREGERDRKAWRVGKMIGSAFFSDDSTHSSRGTYGLHVRSQFFLILLIELLLVFLFATLDLQRVVRSQQWCHKTAPGATRAETAPSGRATVSQKELRTTRAGTQREEGIGKLRPLESPPLPWTRR